MVLPHCFSFDNIVKRGYMVVNPNSFIQQPAGSNLCGQACVAILLDIGLNQSIKLFGTRGGTKTRLLCRALGIKHRRLKVIKNLDKLPNETIICKVTWNHKGSHWIIVDKSRNLVIDPSLDQPTFYSWYIKEFLVDRGGITSYLPLN